MINYYSFSFVISIAITFNDNPTDLGRISIELSECPQCQQHCKTKIEYENFLWRFLPVFNSFKNIDHYCSECGAFIGSSRKNSRII